MQARQYKEKQVWVGQDCTFVWMDSAEISTLKNKQCGMLKQFACKRAYRQRGWSKEKCKKQIIDGTMLSLNIHIDGQAVASFRKKMFT